MGNPVNPLKVIVLGSGNSGSGAVYDYLAGRPDFYVPLEQEFRLIQDPGGLSDLYAAVSSEFYLNRASAAIHNFRDFCRRCGRSKKGYPKGLNYDAFIDGFDRKVDRYLDRITSVSYEAMPFCERSKLSPLKAFLYERKKLKAYKKGGKPKIGTVLLPVDRETFFSETVDFLESILLTDTPDEMQLHKPVVINQGGSFWSPVSSTQYYGDNRKVIVVSRDPRGIYSSQKLKGYAYPGGDVSLFCNWYKNAMTHINKKEWENERVIHIRYEDFVTNFDEEKVKLDQKLGIDEHVESTTDMEKSAKNADKFRDRITKDEIAVIKKELRDFLQI